MHALLVTHPIYFQSGGLGCYASKNGSNGLYITKVTLNKGIYTATLFETHIQMITCIQGLAKVSIPLQHFHILSCYPRLLCIFIAFDVIDQHKVVHNCEREQK
ncbi:hypothetical protein XENOCAPTIV_001481 [Xenoophorus captivus]|uniref:Uncharacterized protein n=1 Tax=Xenoophorus captivus TaxID=1517983 RepID=A0ABV0RN59_9TELE